MSRLITRCPACQTMFRVVPDQLRMSAGWVRCGQCQAAFDASAQLQSPSGRSALTATADNAAEASLPVQTTLQSAPRSASQAAPASASSVDVDTTTPDPVASGPVEPQFADPYPADPHLAEAASPAPSVDLLLDDLTWAEPPPLMAPGALEALEVPEAAVREQLENPAGPVQAEDEEGPAHSPAQTLRQASPWGRRWLVLAWVALTLILVLQVVRHERHRIAAAVPAARPLLQALCRWTACDLQLLRQPDAILLDSASFLKVRDGVYRLNLTLRNTARWDLALPAIELVLTDAEDQTLLRRVLPATDLGVPEGRLPAGMETPVSLLLGIEARELSSRVVGYHALAFYP